ncbi:hypothetical protein CO172_02460 [Candidatus Uhrbacteria bacterium CG_4_9_14_3_um_filter_36_7]|uniref:Uncharacterized protein n=1 Tax=Candidatus Uhrbacteria bacterium CG_4_9_14_3_um_filter_36_7 TaxID=1975033 RepID=A0A2M7XHQ3_9BACT|nr:MAG: hypothetical protein CO172_02460 [Candidatus Uhrbacteria bacterium CG_4_9_14_3_um_filter_36_7]
MKKHSLVTDIVVLAIVIGLGYFFAVNLVVSSSKPDSTPKVAETKTKTVEMAPPVDVDRSFETKADQELWQQRMHWLIGQCKAVEPPEKVLALLEPFQLDPRSLIQNKEIWDLPNTGCGEGQPVADDRTSQEKIAAAKELQAKNEKWPAANLFLNADGSEGITSALECLRGLDEEGSPSWMATAKIAIRLLPNSEAQDTLTRVLNEMFKADQITRLNELKWFALGEKKISAVREISTLIGRRVTQNIEPQVMCLARTGQTKELLPDLIQEDLKIWVDPEAPKNEDVVFRLVEAIVLLGREDQTRARMFAQEFLSLKSTNLISIVSCGEGCYGEPIKGTFDLYQLIKSDPALRSLYLERTKRFIQELVWSENNELAPCEKRNEVGYCYFELQMFGLYYQPNWFFDAWGEPGHFYGFLSMVKQAGDQVLVRSWESHLDILAKIHPYEAVVGSMILDVPPPPSAKLSGPEDFLVAKLRGEKATVVETYNESEKEGWEEVINVVANHGSVTVDAAKDLWMKIGFSIPTETRLIDPEDFQTTLVSACQLKSETRTYEYGVRLLTDLYMSGFKQQLPDGCSWGDYPDQQLAYAMCVGGGVCWQAKKLLTADIRRLFWEVIGKRRELRSQIFQELHRPYNAVRKNGRTIQLVVWPTNLSSLKKLVDPVLSELQRELPDFFQVFVFSEALVCDYPPCKLNTYGVGRQCVCNEGPYFEEVQRLIAAGNLDELSAWTSAFEAYKKTQGE